MPLGPKLVFMTSSRPLAALMFMKRAAVCPMVSARGLSVLTDMVAFAKREGVGKFLRARARCALRRGGEETRRAIRRVKTLRR